MHTTPPSFNILIKLLSVLSSVDSMCAAHLIQAFSEAAPKAHQLAHTKIKFLSVY